MRVSHAFLLALSVFAAGCAAPANDAATTESTAADSVLSDKLLVDQLTTAVAGYDYVSETDAYFDVLDAADDSNGAPIDPDLVRVAFNRPTLVNSEVRDFDDWFADESDEQMLQARDLMRANMTDLTVVLLAENSFVDTDDSPGELEIFIVGRSRVDGALVALHTLAVWT